MDILEFIAKFLILIGEFIIIILHLFQSRFIVLFIHNLIIIMWSFVIHLIAIILRHNHRFYILQKCQNLSQSVIFSHHWWRSCDCTRIPCKNGRSKGNCLHLVHFLFSPDQDNRSQTSAHLYGFQYIHRIMLRLLLSSRLSDDTSFLNILARIKQG